tara:strand:- start:332 stop:1198 length:867 start_codon:yes stop_codon:yes gene_type:complete
MKHFEKITIQIVIYEETLETISKCLNNLKKFKVIILDNANNYKLKSELINKYKIQKYILEKKNIGYSKGHNKIASYVDTEYLLILNADCIIDERNIFSLYEVHKNNLNCGVVGPTTYDKNNNLTFNGGLLPENGNKFKITNIEGNTCFQSILGSSMLLRKEDFLKVGMFNERLFLFYSDDDLCRKFKNLKKPVIQAFNARAIHTHGINKVKNIFKGIFLKEFYMTFDELQYYLISGNHQEKFYKLKSKISNYCIKFFINLFLFKINKSILYISRIIAYNKFRKKIRDR